MSYLLHLDPQIRDLVLIPIVLVVILSSLLRSNLTRLVGQPSPKADPGEIKRAALFGRIRNLKANGKFLSRSAWRARKAIFLDKDHGLLWNVPEQKNAMEQMLSQNQDPTAATGMLVSQISFVALHGTIGYWISHMFSGFLVAKAPFSLTFKIKSMFQRGIEVPALDSSYVSSLSFYFFVMMSCSGLISLIQEYIGQSRQKQSDSTSEMAMMATGGMVSATPPAPSFGQTDVKKVYETERENMEICKHDFALKDCEAKLLQIWKSRK